MDFLGLDLNGNHEFCDPAKHDFAGVDHERRQTRIRTADAASAIDNVSPVYGALPRRV